MKRRLWLLGVLGVAIWTFEPAAHAQSQSLFGGSGPRSQSRTASQLSTGGRAGGTSGGSSLGTGRATAGRGTSGRGTTGGAFSGPQLNDVGSLSQMAVGTGTGFVGRQNSGEFVGNRLAGQQIVPSMQPSFTLPRGGGSFGLNRQNNPQNNFNAQNRGSAPNGTQQRTFRPQYRVGFEVIAARPAEVAERVEAQMVRFRTANPALSDLEVNIDANGIAELRGEVPTEAMRDLVANVVRLEPGVRGVRNLVEVVEQPPAQE